MSQLVSFEEYINHLYIDMSIPGYFGVDARKLDSLSDIECSKLLCSSFKIQDYLGNPILRNQIKKTFFSNQKNFNILVKSNVADLIHLISQQIELTEITIHNELKNKEEIAIYLFNIASNSQNIFYFIDKWGIGLNNMNLTNLIILSSLDLMYGIKGISVSWAYVSSNKLYEEICASISYCGPSASYTSEIYSIIAIRNDQIIKAINYKVIQENYKELEIFLNTYKSKLDSINFSLHSYCKIYFKDKNLSNSLIKNKKLLLRIDKDGGFFIHYGQKNFISNLVVLGSYIT